MKISAGQKVSYNVSYLRMDSVPTFEWPSWEKANKIEICQKGCVSTDHFLSLYQKVGENHEWTDLLLDEKDQVGAFINHDSVEFFELSFETNTAGFFVLDFREKNICDLAYFGLISNYIGMGLGSYLLPYAILTAWRTNIQKMSVNTNTLDHKSALPLYKKYGFKVIKVEKHTRILSNDRDYDEGCSLVL